MTRAMAVDAGSRVRVNAIEPAAIDTEMLRAGFAGDPEGLGELARCHPQGRIGRPQEVARTLEDALAAGKIGAIGVSNFTIQQTEALAAFLDTPLATTQPEVSPLRIDCFENGELDQAMRLGLTPLAWSPLGGGQLLSPASARDKAVVAELDRVAGEQGVSRTVAAYSWLMAHPARIIPIVGSQNPERIAEAAGALSVRWTRQDWYAVLVAARGERLP